MIVSWRRQKPERAEEWRKVPWLDLKFMERKSIRF